MFILGHGIEQGRGELGAKGKEQQLQTGFDPQLGVGVRPCWANWKIWLA